MIHAELVDHETGKVLGTIHEDIFPRKGETLWLTKGRMISKYAVDCVEWDYEINTAYPNDTLIFHCPRIYLNLIITVPKSASKCVVSSPDKQEGSK